MKKLKQEAFSAKFLEKVTTYLRLFEIYPHGVWPQNASMASQQEQDALRQMILAFRVPDLQLLLGKQIVDLQCSVWVIFKDFMSWWTTEARTF